MEQYLLPKFVHFLPVLFVWLVRQRALALGANAYITKPIQAPQVIEAVKQLLTL
jgi:CheY-like chemotaxis protein